MAHHHHHPVVLVNEVAVVGIIEVEPMGAMVVIVMAEGVVSRVVGVEFMMGVETKEGTEVVILTVATREEKMAGTVRFLHHQYPHLVVLVALIHHHTMVEVQITGLMQFLHLQATAELRILQLMLVPLVAMVVIV